MMKYHNSLRSLAPVLVFLHLVLIGLGLWLLFIDKAQSFRVLTRYHYAVADYFFKYITHLGDGIFILALAAVLASLKRYFFSLGIVSGYLLSGIFAQIGKRMLNMPRPKAWFENIGETVYQVEGVNVHLNNSFPSGHTASVFALAVFLIFTLPYRWYTWLIILGAILVGYSRIYLSQHFPVDVWAGAIIGSFSGLMVYLFLRNSQKRNPKYLNSKFQNTSKV
jgi:membrane-associated phospholipid phosphatase